MDLKPNNILVYLYLLLKVNRNAIVKIIDFGEAQDIKD